MQKNIRLIILACSIVLLISSSIIPILSANQTTKAFPSDLDPLTDISVTVDIQKIRSYDKYDWQMKSREFVDENSDPDFYVVVLIDGERHSSPVWRNTKSIYDVNWSATSNVADDKENVVIQIQLWDQKDGDYTKDRLCDISADSGDSSEGYTVDLTYNIKTGHWNGEDSLGDKSGYGRLNGCDDGSIYEQQRDAELWFNIYQTDYDGDNIPYWTEVNVYGTNPRVSDIGSDEDDDDIPIEWEHKWGFDPFSANNFKKEDPDDDGLVHIEEYWTSQWFSDPFRKDLFIELDQMQESPDGEQSLLPENAKEMLFTAYDRRNVVYHLDDGRWDETESEIIPFDDECNYNDLINIYETYFLHGDEQNWRRGVFHYGIVIYRSWHVAGMAFRPNCFYITSRGHEKKAGEPFLDRNTVYASAFMHETGHNLGFWPIPGHNHFCTRPWQIGWWLTRPYRSCMNYGWMYTTVDYSDGRRGLIDFNDWERMDLTYFQRDW